MLTDETRKEYNDYPETIHTNELKRYCDFLLEKISKIQCFPPQGHNPKIVESWLSGYNACIVEINGMIRSIKTKQHEEEQRLAKEIHIGQNNINLFNDNN